MQAATEKKKKGEEEKKSKDGEEKKKEEEKMDDSSKEWESKIRQLETPKMWFGPFDSSFLHNEFVKKYYKKG